MSADTDTVGYSDELAVQSTLIYTHERIVRLWVNSADESPLRYSVDA